MNPSLVALKELADATVPDRELTTMTNFEIYLGDECVKSGYYLSHSSRDRQCFAQAAGKLINAGYEITTFK